MLSVAKSVPKSLLQTALAAGADRAIAVEDPQFENLDPYSTAAVLGRLDPQVGSDSIWSSPAVRPPTGTRAWCGRASRSIWMLPCVTLAQKVELRDGEVVVESCVSDGIEVVESVLPALVTVSNEAGELRNISLAALMKAKQRRS